MHFLKEDLAKCKMRVLMNTLPKVPVLRQMIIEKMHIIIDVGHIKDRHAYWDIVFMELRRESLT